MSFSVSPSNLLSFSPEEVDESSYYDSLILTNRGRLSITDAKVPKGMGGVKALILAYNPDGLSVNRSVSWKAEATNGNTNQQSFGGGGEDTMSVPILLDGSEWDAAEDGGGSIIEHLKLIHHLSTPYEAVAGTTPRPPTVAFQWGDLTFVGVVTKIGTKIEMFNDLGDPMRAVVTLDLKGQFLAESIEEGVALTLGALKKPAPGTGGSKEEETPTTGD